MTFLSSSGKLLPMGDFIALPVHFFSRADGFIRPHLHGAEFSAVQAVPPPFVESEGSLSCSQEPAAGP